MIAETSKPMASDGLIREVFDLAKTWLKTLEASVAVESHDCNLAPLAPPARPAELDRPDERFSKLAETSMLQLPLPMQTLLKALYELKQDMCRDGVLQRQNYEARQIATIEGSITGALKTLEAYRAAVDAAKSESMKTVRKASLEAELQQALDASGLQERLKADPKDWWPQMQHCLQATEAASAARLRESAASKPVHRQTDSEARSETISQVDSAVKASQATRERLIKLAQGPLASLFETPAALESKASVKMPSDSVAIGGPAPIGPTDSDAELGMVRAESVEKVKSLMRRIQRLYREAFDSQRDFIDSARISAEDGLRALRRALRLEEPLTASVAPDLARADRSLQSEIALIMKTLTVERQSLDMVLRHIKATCKVIQDEASAESVLMWAVKAASWRMQLEEAYSLTHRALSR